MGPSHTHTHTHLGALEEQQGLEEWGAAQREAHVAVDSGALAQVHVHEATQARQALHVAGHLGGFKQVLRRVCKSVCEKMLSFSTHLVVFFSRAFSLSRVILSFDRINYLSYRAAAVQVEDRQLRAFLQACQAARHSSAPPEVDAAQAAGVARKGRQVARHAAAVAQAQVR